MTLIQWRDSCDIDPVETVVTVVQWSDSCDSDPVERQL